MSKLKAFSNHSKPKQKILKQETKRERESGKDSERRRRRKEVRIHHELQFADTTVTERNIFFCQT